MQAPTTQERMARIARELIHYGRAMRLEQRTRYDLEMLREIGYCQGIENYSRHFTGLAPGEPPPTLLDYFSKDFLVIIDESNPFASVSSEIAFQIQQRAFDYLDAPVLRVTAKDIPAPYAKNLIEYYMPRVDEAVEACKRVMYAK